MEANARSQQYLTPAKEKAMVDFVLEMSDLRIEQCQLTGL
jgi:hypothetical protein